ADLLHSATAVMWDQLPMINRAGWECADELCRALCHRPKSPFGGLAFIAGGDFCQVAPVMPGGGETATLAASVKSLPL
ncbi:hypothetical protein PAXRUDRAFT_45944, partial [Paxillus rubicundulus Ve08.2h10]